RGGTPVQPTPLAGDEEAHLDRGVHLAERELRRLPSLLGDELSRLLPTRPERKRELANEPTTFDGRLPSPSRLRRARGGDGGFDVRRPRPCRSAEESAVGRAQLLEPCAGGRRPACTVDQVRDVRDRADVQV